MAVVIRPQTLASPQGRDEARQVVFTDQLADIARTKRCLLYTSDAADDLTR